MNEERLTSGIQQEDMQLDERLALYYRTEVQEQPLSEASWLALQAQLSPRKKYANARRHIRGLLPHHLYASSTSLPAYIQERLIHVAHNAHIQVIPPVQYSIQRRGQIPTVHISALGSGKIYLRVPARAVTYLPDSPELDVTLAVGLARYLYMRTPRFRSKYLMSLCGLFLLLPLLLMSWLLHIPLSYFVGVLLATVVLTGSGLWYLYTTLRRVAFQSDMLTVMWLGRERVCQGLHALADRTFAPQRKSWGDASLTERIERVCGVRTPVRDENLTLVH